jgi:DNA repair protein RadC
MPDPTSQLKFPGADGLCPGCAGEHARFYRPGAPEDRPQITSPEAAADLLVPLLQGLDREHAVTLNLDVKHRLIATTTVSIGSVDHTFMSPREVFRDALRHGAGAIVIAHNHPSGDAEPSRDDARITRRLGQAGEILDIDVLDHLVIGHERWVSLARRGVLLNRGPATDFRDDRSATITVDRVTHR